MTTSQKAQIAKLRNEGCSYADTAEKLGLQKGAVKSYCVRHDLGGRRSQVRRSAAHSISGVCEQCGKPVNQTAGRKHKRFCCKDCRMQWWNEYRRNQPKKTDNLNKKTMTAEINAVKHVSYIPATQPFEEEPIERQPTAESEQLMTARQFISEYVFFLCKTLLREMLKMELIKDDEKEIVLDCTSQVKMDR